MPGHFQLLHLYVHVCLIVCCGVSCIMVLNNPYLSCAQPVLWLREGTPVNRPDLAFVHDKYFRVNYPVQSTTGLRLYSV